MLLHPFLSKPMTRFNSEHLKDIARLAGVAAGASHIDDLRKDMIEIVHRAFRSDSTIFWLTDENNMLIDPVLMDIQTQFLGRYKSHFYQQNPFDPTNFISTANPSVAMEQLISLTDFRKTEYFNDFLNPQKINRQMAVYIPVKGKLSAVLGMHRSPYKSFEKPYLEMGNMVADHLSAVFEKLLWQKQLEKKENLFQMVCEHTAEGIMILDKNMKLVFCNEKAGQINSRYKGQVLLKPDFNGDVYSLPAFIHDDCQSILITIQERRSIPTPLAKSRLVSVSQTEKYRFNCQWLEKNQSGYHQPLFMITSEEIQPFPEINDKTLMISLHLTRREAEIVMYLFKGYKNSEIAKTLFIAPISKLCGIYIAGRCPGNGGQNWNMINLFSPIRTTNPAARSLVIKTGITRSHIYLAF